jgi:hypothetical protein
MVTEERRRQLDRILNSGTFRQAGSLRRLLSYLGEKSLNGEADQLKEYTVGLEAFGKPPTYNPQQDASVRVQAAKLRQKLEEYYRTEGAADPVRVHFPKGHFRLEFESRPEGPPPKRRLLANPTFAGLAGAFIGATLSLLAAFLAWRAPAPPAAAWTPELEELWQPFLESSRPLLIGLGTPMFAHFGPVFLRDPAANEPQELEGSPYLAALRKGFPALFPVPTYLYTGVGEAIGATELVRLLAGRRREVTIKRSASVSWEDIERQDVIFLGSTKFNPQLKDLPGGLELLMVPGEIVNLKPRPGEPASLRGQWPNGAPYRISDYALITRIHGLHQQGEMLILGANSTEGTLAAVRYMTQPSYAADLVAKLKQGGRLPRHYQVVLHARLKQGMPVEVSYQFHHILGEERSTPRTR